MSIIRIINCTIYFCFSLIFVNQNEKLIDSDRIYAEIDLPGLFPEFKFVKRFSDKR